MRAVFECSTLWKLVDAKFLFSISFFILFLILFIWKFHLWSLLLNRRISTTLEFLKLLFAFYFIKLIFKGLNFKQKLIVNRCKVWVFRGKNILGGLWAKLWATFFERLLFADIIFLAFKGTGIICVSSSFRGLYYSSGTWFLAS